MWLRRRLATATVGLEQLDRKLRILLPEAQRLRRQADERRADWTQACAAARTWVLRAALLGGQDALRAATPLELVEVDLVWTRSFGLRYPTDAVTRPAVEPEFVPGNAAVPAAVEAARRALDAGARTAAADEAVRRLEAEIAITRRRLRALENRWVPALTEALAALDVSLEQAEQDDTARLRRALGGLWWWAILGSNQ